MPELRTDRLVLRGWRPDDREVFAGINADPQVTRYLGAGGEPLTREQSDALVDRAEADWARWGYGLFAVELRAQQRLIGFTGLNHHRARPDDVEIGWRLDRSMWGRGLATEAALAVRDWAFRTLGLPELISITLPANVASRRVMEKIGLRYRDSLEFEGLQLWVFGAERPG